MIYVGDRFDGEEERIEIIEVSPIEPNHIRVPRPEAKCQRNQWIEEEMKEPEEKPPDADKRD